MSNAYMGYRLRGVDEAAKFLFGVDAEYLDVHEAILIASMLVYPLPKAIRTGCRGHYNGWEDFLGNAKGIDPKWVRNIRRRMNYGLTVFPKIKEPR